ncbi:MAG: hypothetical protein KAX40_00435 [Herpetosiphon sp.]|nr:hypothetical protein [Herpetosiphon sp.]
MSIHELITTLDEGVREGRIAPYLADFIAAQALQVEVEDVGYSEWGASDQAILKFEPPLELSVNANR